LPACLPAWIASEQYRRDRQTNTERQAARKAVRKAIR
jgi:hypothetical protein